MLVHVKCILMLPGTPIYYNDVIIGSMASQITSLIIVNSTVYSGTDERKHQSSASLAFVWGIHGWPVNSPHKWPVKRKMFPFDDVIMVTINARITGGICIKTSWHRKAFHFAVPLWVESSMWIHGPLVDSPYKWPVMSSCAISLLLTVEQSVCCQWYEKVMTFIWRHYNVFWQKCYDKKN